MFFPLWTAYSEHCTHCNAAAEAESGSALAGPLATPNLQPSNTFATILDTHSSDADRLVHPLRRSQVLFGLICHLGDVPHYSELRCVIERIGKYLEIMTNSIASSFTIVFNHILFLQMWPSSKIAYGSYHRTHTSTLKYLNI